LLKYKPKALACTDRAGSSEAVQQGSIEGLLQWAYMVTICLVLVKHCFNHRTISKHMS
jgi:hypothetical protein